MFVYIIYICESAVRTPAGGGFHTPSMDGSRGAVTPTPIRDKLSINPEEGLDIGDTPQAVHNYQRQVRKQVLSTFQEPVT